MVNGIKLNQIYQYQITLFYLMCVSSSFAYKYHLVNGVSLGLAESDPTNWRLLYCTSGVANLYSQMAK